MSEPVIKLDAPRSSLLFKKFFRLTSGFFVRFELLLVAVLWFLHLCQHLRGERCVRARLLGHFHLSRPAHPPEGCRYGDACHSAGKTADSTDPPMMHLQRYGHAADHQTDDASLSDGQ